LALIIANIYAGRFTMMMMSFICSCRNKNQPKAMYPKGTSHHTRLFRGPSTNGMKILLFHQPLLAHSSHHPFLPPPLTENPDSLLV
jgi:hypothetical protein